MHRACLGQASDSRECGRGCASSAARSRSPAGRAAPRSPAPSRSANAGKSCHCFILPSTISGFFPGAFPGNCALRKRKAAARLWCHAVLGFSMTRILIADDHDVVRSGLRLILEAHPGWEIVAEAADGKDAVAKALDMRPEVAVLDYSMPMVNGAEAPRQIRKRAPSTEVLIFTMLDNDALVGEVLEAGAKAYLLKSDAKQHLVAAVEALSHHKPYFSDQISEKLLETFLLTQKGQPRAVLSARERIVVQLIAEGHSSKDMGGILNLSIKTIESHRASAMRKLNITSAAGLVRYAIRNRLIEA